MSPVWYTTTSVELKGIPTTAIVILSSELTCRLWEAVTLVKPIHTIRHQEKTDLRKALDGEKGKNTQLTKERDNLKSKAGDLQKSNLALEQDVEKKQVS